MEDENGLELSLGLGCGGSSSKSKGKNGSSSDTRMDKGDRGNKLVDDFINFLHGTTTQKQDSSARSQRSDSVKPQEFFNDLTKNNAEADASINLNSRGLWVSSTNRSAENDEEKRPDLGNKRKLFFDELNNQKKHERDAHHADLHDKKSHFLITTEDGSTVKQFIGVGGPPEATKEVRGFSDSSVVELQGQRRLNGSSENEFKQGNLNYGLPFSVQPVSIMNVPYSFPVNKSNSVGAPSTSGHPITGMIQVLPTSNGEQRTGNQSVNPGNLQVMFGYSPAQLPTLDKDNSWGLISHIQQFPASYAGRALSNAEKQNDGLKISQAMQAIARNLTEVEQHEGSTLGQAKGDGKQLIVEVGSSSHTEDDVKGSTMNLRPKDAPKQSTAETLCFDFSAIKPGIGPAMKFGGCGSYPNLPWVSTTLPGPNGRTISGVTYKYSANQIRIVCACHGSHMSPEEFVRHASEENANPGNGNRLATFPGTNPAASTQS
ncbi:ninja-family protein mc410-like isoform X2 [Populus nigra]|uniref:ninja-family protein mc410-like isoform X2 n=1 Tax=Populus nigra TaxID=3691 RepID=UPI002B26D79F|nr:ninja-family protein mc410-like isoform X2 [Populus nigra]